MFHKRPAPSRKTLGAISIHTNKMRIPKKYYSSIVLLIIGLLMAKNRLLIGDGCQGMPDGILFVVLSVFFIVALIVVIVLSFKKFNFLPFVTTAFVIALVYSAIFINEFESPTLLTASNRNRNTLKIWEDHSFKIQRSYVEWSCYYKGKYQMNGDTLILLNKDIGSLTDNLFSNKYLIDREKNVLKPMGAKSADSIYWLKIQY
jgi:hypothetical protein